MHNNIVKVFTGGVNTDVDPSLLPKEDFIYSMNIVNQVGTGNAGVVNNIEGDVLVQVDLPNGENVCICSVVELKEKFVIYLVYNSNSRHSIYQYRYPDELNLNGTISLVAQSSVFAFRKEWVIGIGSRVIIDSELLYWSDAFSYNRTIEGNPPRKINIKKGLTDKLLSYKIHFNDTSFAVGTNYSLEVVIGTAASSFPNFYNPAAGLTDSQRAGELQAAIDAVSPGLATVIHVAGNEFTLTAINVGTRIEIQSLAVNDIIYFSDNHYPVNIEEHHIDMLKHPPHRELTVCYASDPVIKYNYVDRSTFQFRIRYWYDDNEKSAWGPISLVPSNINIDGDIVAAWNYIQVRMNDPELNEASWRNIVTHVELAVRIDDGVWKSVKHYRISEIGVGPIVFEFYNDQLYEAIESDDNTSGDIQVIKLYDSIPPLAATLTGISDEKGVSRMILGGIEEGHGSEIPLLEYSTTSDPVDTCLIDIKGTVIVKDRDHSLLPANVVNDTVGAYEFKDYSNLGGFVIYLAGTNFYAISNNPEDGTGDGSFEIKNVRPGKYIMRVASYKVRNDNSLGAVYNVGNGILWQSTSSPVIKVAGGSEDHFLKFEKEIDLTGFGPSGGILDLDVDPAYGETWIEHLKYDTITHQSFQAYLLDNQGDNPIIEEGDPLINTDDIIDWPSFRGSIGCELQAVLPLLGEDLDGNGTYNYFDFWNAGTLNGRPFLISDHNGYVYCTHRINVATVALEYPADDFIFTANDGTAGGTRDPSRLLFRGDIGNVYTEDAGNFKAGNMIPVGNLIQNNHLEMILVNTDTTFTENNKTFIDGEILDAGGFGVQDCLAVFSRTGRTSAADLFGKFTISVYVPYNSNERIIDKIIFRYLLDVCLVYPIGPESELTLNLSTFPAIYDFDSGFTVTTRTIPVDSFAIGKQKFLKKGGVYRWGIVYEDRGNRKSTVWESQEKLRIPFHTQEDDFGRSRINWSISHLPPDWATHYRIVRSKDSVYRRFIQISVAGVQYSTINDVDLSPNDTSYNNFNATHILFEISRQIDPIVDNDTVSWFYRNLNDVGYKPVVNDRVRVIRRPDGSLVRTDDIIELEIVGTYTKVTDAADPADPAITQYFLVCEYQEIDEEMGQDWLIEAYTPILGEDIIFYESGDTYSVLNPHTANRVHQGQTQDQTNILPATGILNGGDVYWRKSNYVVEQTANNLILENDSMSDAFSSKISDIGRVNVFDEFFKEKYYYNRLRFSETYTPNSSINGLSSFRSTDIQHVDISFGPIRSTVVTSEVLLVICEHRMQPIYVGKDRVVNLNGSSIGRSDKLLNIAAELRLEIGTIHPESIAQSNAYLYGFDSFRGIFWRYATNGQFPISEYGLVHQSQDLAEVRLNADKKRDKMFGGYDPKINSYVLTTSDLSDLGTSEYYNPKTFIFNERGNRFIGEHSYKRENYSAIGLKFISWKNGQLYLHRGFGNQLNTFNQVRTNSQVKFVLNDSPAIMKLLWNIVIQSNLKWIISEVRTLPSESFPQGMRSFIPDHFIKNFQGHFKADFLRDSTDPAFLDILDVEERRITSLLRGRKLIGELFLITLELVQYTAKAQLKSVQIEISPSFHTK